MMRDSQQRSPQHLRRQRSYRQAADPNVGAPFDGPEAWLRLQREAGNATVLAAMGRSSAPGVSVQRAGGGDETDSTGSTALIAATRAGDRREVSKLLRRKTAVDQRDEFGTTALIYAVDRRDTAVATLLLDAGADPDLVSDELSDDGSKGDTALKVAVTNNDPAMASMLMARGARMEVRDHTGLTAPAWAARRGSLACLKLFLASGWPINHIDTDGFTLLTWAATGGQLVTAQFLISGGFDPAAIPAAVAAAGKQAAAYRWHAADLSSRQVPQEERAQLAVATTALSSKAADVESVIAYLEQVMAGESSP